MTRTEDPRPVTATNRLHGDETVAAAINTWWAALEDEQRPPTFAIATAYYNPGGWKLVADALEKAEHVRLLLGAEPDVDEDMRKLRRLDPRTPPSGAERKRLNERLQQHQTDLETDRNLMRFARDEHEDIQRMVGWLRSGRVEVRRLESSFLHGKAFSVEEAVGASRGVLVGSSNFTYAGLTKNTELNLGRYDPDAVDNVLDWFNLLWDRAVNYDLAGLYERRLAAYDPYLIYLRMLWERYQDDLAAEEAMPEPGLGLTEFQAAGLKHAITILDQHDGVLIADGVGLGKTFIAGELIRRANQELRQRVLLVAPAALRDGTWRSFFNRYAHEFSAAIDTVSYDQLAADPRLGGNGNRAFDSDPNEYAMVVIDEAHAYRNPSTLRYETLWDLLLGKPQKKVVLLTATPVNNSLWDLYHLLRLFIRNEAEFLPSGIPSLRDRFKEAERQAPDELSPDMLFDVLDAVAVRRTRRFVKKFYRHAVIPGTGEPITFPEPHVVRVDYDFEGLLPGFFDRVAHALGAEEDEDEHLGLRPAHEWDFEATEKLTLARYAPSSYLLSGEVDVQEIKGAGLLRSGLLKRFESSAYAFARTCRKMAESHRVFIEALDEGWVLMGDALEAWEKGDTDEGRDALEAEAHQQRPADRFDVETLRRDVQADRDLLIEFAELAERVTFDIDPKLDALVEELADIAKQAKDEADSDMQERNKRKVIVFSYYADTVDWIVRRLKDAIANDDRLAAYQNGDGDARLVWVSGATEKEGPLFGFAPVSSEAPPAMDDDLYDVMVATDVLAEGVNLQQARHIINFDLPWNPMRLVQRHGRIDRIGSNHRRVFLRCFFPDQRLNILLGLERRIREKVQKAATAVGVEGEVIPGSATGEQVFADIDRIRNEDATYLEEHEESGALSGEEFRTELKKVLDNDATRAQQMKDLPWTAGGGRRAYEGERRGFVFCARIADYHLPAYRFVPLDDDNTLDLDEMTSDTLTCLAAAKCDDGTALDLPEELGVLAYEAWDAAMDDIWASWERGADPSADQPDIPKPMRDADALLLQHPPADMTPPEVGAYRDKLTQPVDPKIERMMRSALKSSEDPDQQVAAVIELVDRLDLQPPPVVPPLPPAEKHDIHLVCWTAVH